METEALFSLLKQYEEFNFTLWNIYIAVTLGVLGYGIGSEKIRRFVPRFILAAGFIAFGVGNANYLERNAVLIHATAAEIEQTIGKQPERTHEFKAAVSKWAKMQPESLRIGHHIYDALVVLLLLFGPALIHRVKKGTKQSLESDA